MCQWLRDFGGCTSTETAPVERGPTALPRAERRAQLLTAAATAFVRGGFDGTSMEDVAEQAGVTRLIVYRIFATKEDLYRAVLESVTDRLRDEVSPELKAPRVTAAGSRRCPAAHRP